MVYAQTKTCLRKCDPKIILEFEIQTDHPIPARRPNLVLIKQKHKLSSSWFYHSCRPQRKKEKNLDHAKRLKNVLPIIVGALRT